jgi:hypothetical protein
MSYHITSYHTISCHITSCHITSCHITLHHVTSHHITSHYIISCHITSCHITSYHIMSYHITSHHVTSCHITSHHIISCHITSYHITSHHVMHHIMRYHIISHHVTLQWLTCWISEQPPVQQCSVQVTDHGPYVPSCTDRVACVHGWFEVRCYGLWRVEIVWFKWDAQYYFFHSMSFQVESRWLTLFHINSILFFFVPSFVSVWVVHDTTVSPTQSDFIQYDLI